jgi:hypothetical protein
VLPLRVGEADQAETHDGLQCGCAALSPPVGRMPEICCSGTWVGEQGVVVAHAERHHDAWAAFGNAQVAFGVFSFEWTGGKGGEHDAG